MTMPRYARRGCAAGSQALGDTSAPDYAWGVNLNNGNANINNRNNDGLALPVSELVLPPGQYQSAESVTPRELYDAWREARRGKRPSCNQLRFEADWWTGLRALERAANDGSWTPGPTTCFIALSPKAREIHAPEFADRVMHHYLVPRLEAYYEPTFIHDSYANRKGKGTHAAVQRVWHFSRQLQNARSGGWYLQLDIRNFFNSIHRPTLWAMLKRRLQQHGAPQHLLQLTHALLRQDVRKRGVRYRCTAAERARVPSHKRLDAAPPGYGIAIGDLSSQFFANVYLDVLDQYIKHVLKVRRYVRFADDFVLLHESREQLLQWQAQIETFLQQRLRLQLKAERKLQPLSAGIDFLGYVIRPTHLQVRRRVVSHAKEKLQVWQQRHVASGRIQATPAQLREIAAVWRSYEGHLQHASTWRLRVGLHQRFPWLASVLVRRRFAVELEGRALAL